MFQNLGFLEKFQHYQTQQKKLSKQDFDLILINI